jgi:hypothetical protein
MFVSWMCKSSSRRDGRKVRAKRKSVTVRWGLKECRAKARADVQKPDLRHTPLDEQTIDREVCIHKGHF